MNENERPFNHSAATGDDGSLAALNIAPDENNKHFNCSETTQQKLINTTFWVVDYIDGVKTKFGESRFLVKIKPERKPPENPAKMKRVNNLFDKICSIENLQLADEKARKRKKSKYGIQLHDRNREANILALREALLNGTFRTSEYSTFTIFEPKERLIYRLPYYPDRILHHAIMNVLEPIWLSVFTADTYSCIKNKGIHAAAQAVKTVLRKDPEGTAYCLKLDIRKFYPSIDHGIMKEIIRRKLKDARLLQLLDGIIDSADGIPIGNYLSQYLANLYLAYFDHWLKEEKRVKYYFRYADDMVIFASNKAELHGLITEIKAYLSERLKLEVKSNWQIFPTDSRGVDFLGFVFFHKYTLLRKKVKQNFCRAVARINRRKVQLDAKAYKQALCSWWGWVKYSNSKHFYKQLSKKFQYEIKFR